MTHKSRDNKRAAESDQACAEVIERLEATGHSVTPSSKTEIARENQAGKNLAQTMADLANNHGPAAANSVLARLDVAKLSIGQLSAVIGIATAHYKLLDSVPAKEAAERTVREARIRFPTTAKYILKGWDDATNQIPDTN